jgi:hypothetical protein
MELETVFSTGRGRPNPSAPLSMSHGFRDAAAEPIPPFALSNMIRRAGWRCSVGMARRWVCGILENSLMLHGRGTNHQPQSTSEDTKEHRGNREIGTSEQSTYRCAKTNSSADLLCQLSEFALGGGGGMRYGTASPMYQVVTIAIDSRRGFVWDGSQQPVGITLRQSGIIGMKWGGEGVEAEC